MTDPTHPTGASDLEQLVLHHVSLPGYQPVKARVLSRQLGLPDERHADLKKTVKQMVKQGKLAYGSSRVLHPASGSAKNQVTGVFSRAAGGFGFVRPRTTDPSGKQAEDIYIPARKTLDAATGDVVLVRLGRRSRDESMRQTGVITAVIERETHQFVGTYRELAGNGYVQVDGALFAQPILVGDASAKNVKPDDKVVIEMVRFPSPTHAGEGVITEVLGDRGRPGVDTLLVIREFGLPERFAEEVLENARQQAESFDESLDQRTDLTDRPIITIDPEDARDFDDAVSLERMENGHWLLGVHIADVAHFIPPKSPLDVEARQRATSVYLPDRVIPMLPEVISNNLASLQPDRVRYARSVSIEWTADGARVHTDIFASAIKSKRRFTYEEVDDFLAHRAKWKRKLPPAIHQLLCQMHDLAMILRQRRTQRGAIELAMPEIELEMDRDGKVTGAHRVLNTVSHQIIEEFMLAANEAVAEYLRDRQLYFLRRIHGSPDPYKLRGLTEFVRGLGLHTGSLESRFEIQRLLAQVADRPEKDAVNYAVLRSMKKAVYGPQEEGHYALASECYCHFTSPIRRYPDLTVHRMLEELSRGAKPVSQFGPLLALGEHCSDCEQRAEAAERELTKIKLLDFLSTRLGMEMDAVVTGVQSFGLFAQGLQLPAEGLIHISSLADDYYDFDGTSHTLIGRRSAVQFRLGDTIRVAIVRVDRDRRELDFRVVGRGPRTVKTAPAGTAAPRDQSTASRRRSARGGTDGKPSSGRPKPRTRRSRGKR